MYKIKLEYISPWAIKTVKESFNRLPKTEHRDGQYRLRRYSRIKLCDTDHFKYMKLEFLESSGLVDDHEIEIHQIRIVARNESTPVSPEGVHQDGFRFIAMIGVDRHNITGGNLLVSKTCEGKPIVDFPLEGGEMVMLDDGVMWHNATQIKPISSDTQGWMDAFILTAE